MKKGDVLYLNFFDSGKLCLPMEVECFFKDQEGTKKSIGRDETYLIRNESSFLSLLSSFILFPLKEIEPEGKFRRFTFE